MTWRRWTRCVERWGNRATQERWSRFLARSFCHRLRRCTSLEEKVRWATGKSPIRSNQRVSEMLALLHEVSGSALRAICEIGSDRGGTLALLADIAQPDALLISIDPAHHLARSAGYTEFAHHPQRIVTLPADSHDESTLARVKQELSGQPLDLLFIDGDHSYEGVREDYRMYAPLLRAGGWIAFHDIVPESADSDTYVGGVPRFFREHVQTHHRHVSCLIEDSQQDGFGIGLVRWPGGDEGRSILAALDPIPSLSSVSMKTAPWAA